MCHISAIIVYKLRHCLKQNYIFFCFLHFDFSFGFIFLPYAFYQKGKNVAPKEQIFFFKRANISHKKGKDPAKKEQINLEKSKYCSKKSK